MKPRFEEARRRASAILEKAGINKPPVSLERVTSLLGLYVHYEPYAGQLSGMIHRLSNGATVVGVNSLHPRTRQRFTIAHEIGHFILHKSETLHVDEFFPFAKRDQKSSSAEDTREIEANQFAAELLMPSKLLKADIQGLFGDLDFESSKAIKKLAKRYGVSEQAMTIRLSRL